MKDFTLKFYGETSAFVGATNIDAATVIEAGDMVMLDAGGLIVKADASATAIAYTPSGSADGSTEILITDGMKTHQFLFIGVPTRALALTDRGATCGIAISGADQQVDLDAGTVFKVAADDRAGATGSTTKVGVILVEHI